MASQHSNGKGSNPQSWHDASTNLKKRLEKGEKTELWWPSYKGLAGGPKMIAPKSERMPNEILRCFNEAFLLFKSLLS